VTRFGRREVLEIHSHGSVLEVTGSLDAEGARQFLAAVRRLDGDIRVDGSGLRAVDGAGLTALVEARRMCRERDATFAVLELPADAVRHLRARRQLPRLFGPDAPEASSAAPTPLVGTPESAPAPAPPRRRRFTFRHVAR
jgi:anti-anti-sigma regulatory factor